MLILENGFEVVSIKPGIDEIEINKNKVNQKIQYLKVARKAGSDYNFQKSRDQTW